METNNYYTIMIDKEGLLYPVSGDSFQAYDFRYDETRIFKDKEGNKLYFYDFEDEVYVNGENKAIIWLNENIKQEKIDPSYRRPQFKQEDYFL
ncbi:hypothetical protein D3C71_1678470 [compost metagenome]